MRKGYKPCHRRLSSCFFMLVMQIMRFNFQGLSRAERSQSLISTFLESESLKAYFLLRMSSHLFDQKKCLGMGS